MHKKARWEPKPCSIFHLPTCRPRAVRRSVKSCYKAWAPQLQVWRRVFLYHDATRDRYIHRLQGGASIMVNHMLRCMALLLPSVLLPASAVELTAAAGSTGQGHATARLGVSQAWNVRWF